jgi:hypothetical protein
MVSLVKACCSFDKGMVQQPTTEPIINIADYFLWALQRKFERDETRYVDFLGTRIRSVQSLYYEETDA